MVMQRRKRFFLVFILIASVGAVLTYNYFTFVEFRNIDMRLALHHEILDGQAPSPYNYRVLVPFLTESFAKLLSSSGFISYEYSWLLAYVLYDYLCIALFLFTLFLFLEQWHGFSMSLIGVMFCAALLPVSLRDHYFQPWSLLEAWLFCAAFLAAFKKRYSWIVGITIIASLNRLTGIFIPLIYLLGTLDIKAAIRKIDRDVSGQLLRFIGLIAISVTIIIGLRYMRGFNAHIYTLGELWSKNTSLRGLSFSFINLILFGGAGWIFAVLGLKRADRFTYQEALFIPVYIIPFVLFGVWKEVRLLMPLYPIIISLCLFYLRDQFATEGGLNKRDNSI